MKEYVFLRINDRFRNLFSNENMNAFLELYYRRDESVFYKEQFRLFLEKNKQKEMMCYFKSKLAQRKGFYIENNKVNLVNEFNNNKESLELRDNYLILNGNFDKSVLSKYLCEYDSDFLVIDVDKNKIDRLVLAN